MKHIERETESDTSKQFEIVSRRAELEEQYLSVAIDYLELATDDTRHYEQQDLLDGRFNLYYERNMFPRIQCLADGETTAGHDVKHLIEGKYTKLLLAHLGLLTNNPVHEMDVSICQEHVLPSRVYESLLREAGVHIDGVHTQPLSPVALSSLATPFGDRFTPEFIATLSRSNSNLAGTVDSQTQTPYLELVA